MKRSLSILSMLTLFCLTGCDDTRITTPDGTLPPQYIQFLQRFAGTYSATRSIGWGDTISNNFRIRLAGNRPALEADRDVISDTCNSKIGQLEEVLISTDDHGSLTGITAQFHLDRGNCKNINGRTVEFRYFVALNGEEVRRVQVLRFVQSEPRGGARTPKYIIWNLGT